MTNIKDSKYEEVKKDGNRHVKPSSQNVTGRENSWNSEFVNPSGSDPDGYDQKH